MEIRGPGRENAAAGGLTRKIHRILTLAVAAGSFLACLAPRLGAQSYHGAIRGVVRDSSDAYINLAAFTPPPPGVEDGNLGRDAVYGPGFWNIDFSTTKDTHLTEKLVLQLRAEFFNVFNHPQFALPGGVISFTGNCTGCVSTATPDVAQGNPGLGGGGPRVLQFAARFQF